MMSTIDGLNGVLLGRALFQKRGNIGGARSVFVGLQGVKNELVFPPFGGLVKNPPKGAGKVFAGDLMEYRTNKNGVEPEIYLLKTYKVLEGSSANLVRIDYNGGYAHVPFAGDILMEAPSTIGGTGTGIKLESVVLKEERGVKFYECVVEGASAWTANKILVEADQVGGSAKMLVKAINAVAPNDYDFLYEPAATDSQSDFDKARYMLTPALGGLMFKVKMSPIPACVEKLNKCNINGWFEVKL